MESKTYAGSSQIHQGAYIALVLTTIVQAPWSFLKWLDDDRFLGAFNNCDQLKRFRFRNLELVERLLEVIHKGLPLAFCNHKVAVRVAHRSPRVGLRTALLMPHGAGLSTSEKSSDRTVCAHIGNVEFLFGLRVTET
jgi:hypothetical protein